MEVRDLGEDCYLVGDRAVKILNDAIDMKAENGKEILADAMKRLYEKGCHYSLKHVDVFKLTGDEGYGPVYVMGNARVKDLPEKVQVLLGMISDAYVSGEDVPCAFHPGVRDCGNGVYAMYPQALRIEPDVYDLYEQHDVDVIFKMLSMPGKCKGVKTDPLSMKAARFKMLRPNFGLGRMAGKDHMRSMPESVMANLRKEFPEYADAIRGWDGSGLD